MDVKLYQETALANTGAFKNAAIRSRFTTGNPWFSHLDISH